MLRLDARTVPISLVADSHDPWGGTLLLAGDTISQLTSETDTSTQCIFGDAGSATLLTEGDGELLFAMSSFGEKAQAIMVPNSRHRLTEPKEKDGKLCMDGDAVMNFTLGDVPTVIRELLDYSETAPEDIDLYACHQANHLILRFLAKKLKVSENKMPFAACKIGNTSSTSIPLVLASRLEKSNAKTILCGFGVGLAVSACQADIRGLEYLGTVEL